MLAIFVVLWKQGGDVREADGGGLIVIHGDATAWHAMVRHARELSP
jgi:hypothetical protein